MFPLRTLFFVMLFLASVGLRGGGTNDLPPSRILVDSSEFVSAGKVEMTVDRSVEGRWKDEDVWRLATSEAARDPWLAQVYARIKKPVRANETSLLLFQARAVATNHESDQAQFRVVVAERANPFPRIALSGFSLDREWREIAVPFVFTRDYGPGEVELSLDFGYGAQTVEVSGLRLLNFGTTVPVASLPRTRASYPGDAPDAAWRQAALARIETIRKGDLGLSIVDAQGRPVPDASVRVVLRSHAFQFGTAVNVDAFTKMDSPDTEPYRRHVAELFNAGTLENGLKWGNWAGEKKPADYRARTIETLAWLRARDFAVRGHVMVWPGKRFLPEKITSLLGTPRQDRIPGLVLEHIRDIGLATKDYLMEWDVLNEPVNNHDLMDAFGRGIMVDWFREAAKVRPEVPLYLNDWGNHDQKQSPAHVKDFEAIARYLLDEGAPLGGLGLQSHIGGVLSAPEDILATLDRYRKNFNLPVRITEFDVTVDDEDVQAAYTRDFLIATFSHPSVVGVQFWGFWAGRHWQPKAALYRQDWTEKPNGAAYRKLVKETWHTDAGGRTDAAGAWSARGFYGSYTVTVRQGGREHSFVVEHRAGGDGAPSRLTLPDES